MPYKFITNLSTKNKQENPENGRIFKYWRKVSNCDCTEKNSFSATQKHTEKVFSDFKGGCPHDPCCWPKPKKTNNLTKFNDEGVPTFNFSFNTYTQMLQKKIKKCPDYKVKNGNPYFYQYGGVPSSSRIARLKHDAKRSSGDKRGGATRIDRTHVVNTCFSGC